MLASVALLLAFQSKSLLSGVVPKPTGKNGYEEYIQAATLLSSPEADVYAAWAPGAKPPEKDPNDPQDRGPSKGIVDLYAHLASMTPLQVSREEIQRFGRALTLVAQGNAKPVYNPRTALGPSTLFPEFASFKRLTRFATRAATVYAADGQTDRAVDVLMDQLVFADNTSRGVLISNLVGAADTAITLAAIQDLLPRLSESDAAKLQRIAEAVLARPLAARSVLPSELAMFDSALAEAFGPKIDPKELMGSDESMNSRERAILDDFARMGPAARNNLRAATRQRLTAKFTSVDGVFNRPEREWVKTLAQFADDPNSSPSDFGDLFLDMVVPNFSGYALAAVRTRTQLRLLDLHARLIQHRWEYGRLPERLDVIDPLTNEPYVYEKRSDGTIRLASKGISETGEIELRYRRSVTAEKEGEKP